LAFPTKGSPGGAKFDGRRDATRLVLSLIIGSTSGHWVLAAVLLSSITMSYTLCATKSGRVGYWDVVHRYNSTAEWNHGERWELWTCRVEFDQRIVYFTMAKSYAASKSSLQFRLSFFPVVMSYICSQTNSLLGVMRGLCNSNSCKSISQNRNLTRMSRDQYLMRSQIPNRRRQRRKYLLSSLAMV
jgi:hypothetical protein